MKPGFFFMGAWFWQGFAQGGSSDSQTARLLDCASAVTFPNSVKSSPKSKSPLSNRKAPEQVTNNCELGITILKYTAWQNSETLEFYLKILSLSLLLPAEAIWHANQEKVMDHIKRVMGWKKPHLWLLTWQALLTEALGKPDWLALPGWEKAAFHHKVLFYLILTPLKSAWSSRIALV